MSESERDSSESPVVDRESSPENDEDEIKSGSSEEGLKVDSPTELVSDDDSVIDLSATMADDEEKQPAEEGVNGEQEDEVWGGERGEQEDDEGRESVGDVRGVREGDVESGGGLEGEEGGGVKREGGSGDDSDGEGPSHEGEGGPEIRESVAADVFGSSDEDEKRESEDNDSPVSKRPRLDDEDGEVGVSGEVSEENVAMAVVEVGQDDKDSDDEPPDRLAGESDWDKMMQRRKEAMARARRKRKKNYDVTLHDDEIMALIHQMKVAAQEDRQLNLERHPATKKLKMLLTVLTHVKKVDLQTSFIECGILTALADWLQLLPDHSLPHLKIREGILTTLKSLPTPDSSLLKSSKIGKAVMLLYRHPKETKKNKEIAGKLINEWARPIFGLASDFKSLSRDEREERDYAHLSQEARRRLSSSSDKRGAAEEETEPQKPGDKGWVGRARVPMPSTKDYVVRPKWNVEHEFKKFGSSKEKLNRYEKQMQKRKQKKQLGRSTHAVSISVEGRNMPL